jgi:hypothetical protein
MGLLTLGASAQENHTIELHAQDADGDMLQVMMSDRRQAIVVPVGRNIRVSGKIQANDPRAAFGELIKRYPQLKEDAWTKKVKGKGRRVDLWFTGAASQNIFRLLSEVGGVNIIHPPDLSLISISVRNAPWDGVLKIMAQRLGLKEHRRKSTYFYLPKGTKPKITPIKKDRRVTCRLEGVRAGAALEFLGVPCRVDCQAGPPLSLHMRNSKRSHIAAAIRVLSGLDCEKDPKKTGGSCLAPGSLLASVPDVEKLELTGVTTGSRPTNSAGLIKDAQGRLFAVQKGDPVKDGKVVRISRDKIIINIDYIDARGRSVSNFIHYSLKNSLAPPAPVTAQDLRLAATLRMPSYSAAMFEKKDGGFVVYRKYPTHPDQTPGDLHPLVLSKVIGARAELLDQGAKRWIFELGAKGRRRRRGRIGPRSLASRGWGTSRRAGLPGSRRSGRR